MCEASDPKAAIQDQVQAHNLDDWLYCLPTDFAQMHIVTVYFPSDKIFIPLLDSTFSLHILELPTTELSLTSSSTITFIFIIISVGLCQSKPPLEYSLVTSVTSTHIIHSINVNLLFKQLLHKI